MVDEGKGVCDYVNSFCCHRLTPETSTRKRRSLEYLQEAATHSPTPCITYYSHPQTAVGRASVPAPARNTPNRFPTLTRAMTQRVAQIANQLGGSSSASGESLLIRKDGSMAGRAIERPGGKVSRGVGKQNLSLAEHRYSTATNGRPSLSPRPHSGNCSQSSAGH